MRRFLIVCLSLASVAFLAPPAEAGCGLFGRLFGGKSCGSRAQARASYSSGYAASCQGGSCSAQAVPSYQAPSAPNCQNGQCPVPSYQAPAQVPAVMEPAPARGQIVQASLRIAGPVEPQPAQPVAPASPNQGFVDWLNQYRASIGAPPVAEDPNLSAWAARAAMNGYRHSLVVGRNQNVGSGSLSQVSQMWIGDRPHGDPMRDPSIRYVGLGSWGSTWVLNLN